MRGKISAEKLYIFLAQPNVYHNKCILFTMRTSAWAHCDALVYASPAHLSLWFLLTSLTLSLTRITISYAKQCNPSRSIVVAACVCLCRMVWMYMLKKKETSNTSHTMKIHMRRLKQSAQAVVVVVFFSFLLFSLVFFCVFFVLCWHALLCYETHAVLNTLCSQHVHIQGPYAILSQWIHCNSALRLDFAQPCEKRRIRYRINGSIRSVRCFTHCEHFKQ